MEEVEKLKDLNIVIENHAGAYKSFNTEGDPLWSSYPLKGVTYPVDYGYIDGYDGEDGVGLDVFLGSGNLNGFIKVSRMDVPIETKFFRNLNTDELGKVLEVFKPVLISHQVFTSLEEFYRELDKFKAK